MDLDEFAKHHYFWELERRVQLDDSITVPVGLLTALGGILVFYTDSFIAQLPLVVSNRWVAAGIGASAILSVFTLALAVAHLIRSRVSLRTYRYIPTAREIIDYHNALERHYGDESKADEGIRLLLRERYALGATHNCEHNDFRLNLMTRAYYALVVSVVPLLLLTAFYLYVRMTVVQAE